MGRQSSYSEQVADSIIEWISEGKPLREFCRQEDSPVAWRTVYDWLDAHPEFAARFARARDIGADAIAQQALDIADTPVEGVRTEIGGKDGPREIREDMLGHRKLQVETRLKLLAKWFPTKYGEHNTLALTGPNGGPIQTQDIDALTEAQLEAIARTGGPALAEPETGED
jgi:Bacteriophage Sf6, terminase small subunit-like